MGEQNEGLMGRCEDLKGWNEEPRGQSEGRVQQNEGPHGQSTGLKRRNAALKKQGEKPKTGELKALKKENKGQR